MNSATSESFSIKVGHSSTLFTMNVLIIFLANAASVLKLAKENRMYWLSLTLKFSHNDSPRN